MVIRPDLLDLESSGPMGRVDYARWSKSQEAWKWWNGGEHSKDRKKFKTSLQRLCIDGYLPDKDRGFAAKGHDYGDGILQVNIRGHWRIMLFREGSPKSFRWFVTHFFRSRHAETPTAEIELAMTAKRQHESGEYNEVLAEEIKERDARR